jgi:hypothetical protein
MTDEQLETAKTYVSWHQERFGYVAPDVQGFADFRPWYCWFSPISPAC